jgi:hypothetical protein
MAFISPVTVAEVPGGLPVTMDVDPATPPMYGVIVYVVIGLPPLTGACQVSVTQPLPAVAATPVGAPGTVTVPALLNRNTTSAISHSVFAPVATVALGVPPADTG